MFFKSKKFRIIIMILFLTIISIFIFQNDLYKIHRKITGIIILNRLKGYNIKRYIDYDIYFTKKDEENAELIALMVSDYFSMLEKDFDLKLNKPAIIIYPNKNEIKKALGGIEEAPMGAYYGGIIHILSPQSYLTNQKSRSFDFIKKGPIVHEMVHYFIDQKTNGRYCVWFSEGAALYYEYKYLGYEWHSELSGKTNYVSLKDLNKNFKSFDEVIAYRKSFEIIRDEMEGKNNDFIGELCKKYLK